MVQDDTGVWLYAVTREGSMPWITGLTGVDGEPIRVVSSGGLAAVVGTVELTKFGEHALPARLENIDTLAAIARSHDMVIAAAVSHTTTAPMRLATMYFSDDRVRHMLGEHHSDLNGTLSLIDGCAEWGVKGFASTVVPVTQRKPEPATTGAGQGGAAYLRRRRNQLMARNESENVAYRQAETVHDALALLAKQERRHPLQDPKLTGSETAMVLNGAYLVPEEQKTSFAEAVTELGQSVNGVRLELTGPWPTYSFTRLLEATT